MKSTDEDHYIQAFSRIIGVSEEATTEYVQRKGLNALIDNATQLLTTPVQREKHRAFLDLYRMSNVISTSRPILDSPEKAADFFRSVMKEIYDKEAVVVAFLNTKGYLIDHEVVSVGTINGSMIHPREVFRNAIINKAASVILCHNHPSGDLNPSKEDFNVTNRLKETGDLLGIKVLDHLIINGVNQNEVYSFKSQRVLEATGTYGTAVSELKEDVKVFKKNELQINQEESLSDISDNMKVAKGNNVFVLTEQGYSHRATKGLNNIKPGQCFPEYKNIVPKSWTEKGWVKEVPPEAVSPGQPTQMASPTPIASRPIDFGLELQ